MFPRIRKFDLTIKELQDETLVYDLKHQKAHCLNRTAGLVWRQCDGKTTPAEIARILHHDLGITVDEQLVWFALDRLKRARLLEEESAPRKKLTLHSRRALARKLGMALLAVPLVMTIVAPSVAMAASCFPFNHNCTLDSDCCSNHCGSNNHKCLG